MVRQGENGPLSILILNFHLFLYALAKIPIDPYLVRCMDSA